MEDPLMGVLQTFTPFLCCGSIRVPFIEQGGDTPGSLGEMLGVANLKKQPHRAESKLIPERVYVVFDMLFRTFT